VARRSDGGPLPPIPRIATGSAAQEVKIGGGGVEPDGAEAYLCKWDSHRYRDPKQSVTKKAQ